jgi:hypothetical protein
MDGESGIQTYVFADPAAVACALVERLPTVLPASSGLLGVTIFGALGRRRSRNHPDRDRLPNAIVRSALIGNEIGVIAVQQFVAVCFDRFCHGTLLVLLMACRAWSHAFTEELGSQVLQQQGTDLERTFPSRGRPVGFLRRGDGMVFAKRTVFRSSPTGFEVRARAPACADVSSFSGPASFRLRVVDGVGW